MNVCLHARPVGGELTTTSEAAEVWWVEPGDLDGYEIHPAQCRRSDHGLRGDPPHVD
ncbi:hypothetical protein ACIBI3_16675 [Actinomadura luteofluorescens]|uniref:hypothetical protein n=1 Tax=Actinomadura luteofluorescens TaxID=46163 RepID=UPI00347FC801